MAVQSTTLTGVGNIEVRGNVLEWAISDAGLNRAQVVASLDSGLDLSQSEDNTVWISEADLRKIASATRRPLHFFALASPPPSSKKTVSVNFRAPASNDGSPRALNSEERFAVRQAKRRQDIASKLSHKLGEKPVQLLELKSDESPASAAQKAAKWLEWDLKKNRKKLNSKNKVFVALRTSLADHGILTNLVKVDGDSFRGFSLHHEYAPLIFINASLKSPAARSFTLLHELAHLLMGIDKACARHDLQSRTSDEAWCNRFAAAFMMPAEDVKNYLQKYPKKDFVASGDLETLRLVSNYFRTSYFSAAIRLKELGLANEALVKSVSGSFQEEEKPGRAPGKTRPELRLAEFGSVFTRLVDQGLEQASVSEVEARKLFRVDKDELRTLRSLGQVPA
ncbi:ImmA/IrrE family metallo-endopeptidase (plasmid) [Glutamicibacter sp. PAEs-4]|uniref:ImmA/IrrE family metallo-endopeptidase n=1 Tax=Glutamicibacter sp. PAEs-4 TaxID=3444114 RepID=UPI003EB9B807